MSGRASRRTRHLLTGRRGGGTEGRWGGLRGTLARRTRFARTEPSLPDGWARRRGGYQERSRRNAPCTSEVPTTIAVKKTQRKVSASSGATVGYPQNQSGER